MWDYTIVSKGVRDVGVAGENIWTKFEDIMRDLRKLLNG